MTPTSVKPPSKARSYAEATKEADTITFHDFQGAQDLEALVTNIESLGAGELLVIRGQMRPDSFSSSANHLKRGSVVGLPAYQGETVGPTRLRQQVFKQLPNGIYVGYRFMSPNNQEANRVLLTHCIEGARRFRRSVVSKARKDKITVSKLYGSRGESPEIGHIADVEVPSNSDPNKRYVFQLTGIPLHRKERERNWRRIATEGHTGGEKTGKRQSGCEHTYYGQLTLRRPKTTLWCPHAIAAYIAVSAKVREEKGKVIVQPFALPSEKAVAFDIKMRRNVFAQVETAGGKRVQQRALHLDEKEMLHWGHVLAHPDENIFYATNRLNYTVW